MASKLHARSLVALKERGWVPGTVERRMAAFKGKKKDGTPDVSPFGRTVDLWGWCDLVAYHPDAKRLAFVQVCSESGITSHKRKIEEWASMRSFLSVPFRHHATVHLHVWRKPKKGLRSRYVLDCQELHLHPETWEFVWSRTSL